MRRSGRGTWARATLSSGNLIGLVGLIALVGPIGLVGTGCAGEGHHQLPGAHGGPALVEGTVLEAATGEPLEGVLVKGPGHVWATTDGHGRFSLALPAAAVEGVDSPGALVAEGPGGLTATNQLQPLQRERLEVVLHLR